MFYVLMFYRSIVQAEKAWHIKCEMMYIPNDVPIHEDT